MLAPCLVIGGGGEGPAFHDGEVPEVVVGVIDHLVGIGRIVLEFLDGNRLGVVLEDWIDLHGLLEELLQLERVGLEDLQALAHLRCQGLLLAQRLL